MAALEIHCFLNESQMSALTDYISNRLFASSKDDLEDIDTCFDTMGIRMCIDFNIGLDDVELRQAEILDNNWNVMDADSAVLRARLRSIVEAYNDTEDQLVASSRMGGNERKYNLYTY